jgi:type II secretory pathway pseudopilin PulG
MGILNYLGYSMEYLHIKTRNTRGTRRGSLADPQVLCDIQKKIRVRSAFTIVEMLVIIGVLSLMSSILILYSRRAEQQIVLFKEQAKVISILSRAKTLSISTYSYSRSEVPCGYGVHFEAPSTFLIFKDLPTNSNSDCSSSDKKYSGSTSSELVESFQLDSRALFDSLSLSDILFIPPDPKVVITPTPSQDEATVVLKTIDGSKSATIKVNSAGQITTE